VVGDMANRQEFFKAVLSHQNERTVKSYSTMKLLISKLESTKKDNESLSFLVLRNFTIEPLLNFLEIDAKILGLNLDVELGNFDAISQDCSSGDFDLERFEFIGLFQVLETLSPALGSRFTQIGVETSNSEIDRVISQLRMNLSALRSKSTSPIFINTFPLPDYPGFGLADSRNPVGQSDAILKLNSEIRNISRDFTAIYVLDLFETLARCGSSMGFDERMWRIASNPFSSKGMIEISKDLSRIIKVLVLPRKKCLILDCDNVLWSGVIGEEGLKFMNLSVQKLALDLQSTGVFIALASKNNEIDVLEILDNDERVVLKKEHLAAWEINWNDKAENIQKIAKYLNIGLESLVFVDDNLFECNLVRELLPEVSVFHFDGREDNFRRLVIESGLFDALTITNEDKLKSKAYVDNLRREAMLNSTSTFQDYLQNLDIEVEIGIMRAELIPRIFQLSQKTNQFNLTTERLSESYFHSILNNPLKKVLYLRAKDKIAELGLVGIAVLTLNKDYVFIDNLVLSCRALGRGIEIAFLSEIKRFAERSGYRKIVSRFIDSPKNAQVSDYYTKNGFTDSNDFGSGYFEIILDHGIDYGPDWITVEFNAVGGE
jgi:FkbH-like protein